MRKIILIGEFALNLVFDRQATPLGTLIGGRIVNAAAILASKKLPAIMVGEASADQVGDTAISILSDAGVDISCVDRFTEGVTPSQLHFPRKEVGGYEVIRYERYPEECFDVMWPRFSPADIVVFGGFLTIDPRARERVMQLLTSARERGCLMIYLPGFLPSRMPRITRVMPSILDNLETAHVVLTRSADLNTIFDTYDDARAFGNNISFYCNRLINTDPSTRELRAYGTSLYERQQITSAHAASMLWNSAAAAGVIEYIYNHVPTPADLDSITAANVHDMLAHAVTTADRHTAEINQEWKLCI
ncbi:MAG: hypothetical protein K2O12_05610 [Muribaculaceae bacterium]|nr:hypothetical protein [Muribaculaceae bacterium]